MTLEIGLQLLAIGVLLMTSGFFSGSETALTAASRARLHAMELEGNERARRVNGMLKTPERIIGTILLGNNLVNILASALTTSLLLEVFGDVGVAYATIIMTVLVVIFGEVLPKTYAFAYPDKTALTVAPVMSVLITLFRPFTWATQHVVAFLLKLTPSRADDAANILAGHEELRGTIELSHKGGVVERHDANMLGGVLDLGDLEVDDIMVHRTKMETVNADDPPQKIIDEVVRSQYSRVPVWRDNPENIVGVLHTKDLLSVLAGRNWSVGDLDVMQFAKPVWFVPNTTGVKDQLNAFLRAGTQLALVVDEYGEVQGLITLEDILEEIVGQIADEHDVGDTSIRPQPDGSVNVEGTVAIRDLNREMEWALPDEEATTIAGLVIHEAQTIPDQGQVFTFHGYRFEIVRKTRNKIAALRVKPVPVEASTSRADDKGGGA